MTQETITKTSTLKFGFLASIPNLLTQKLHYTKRSKHAKSLALDKLHTKHQRQGQRNIYHPQPVKAIHTTNSTNSTQIWWP